VAPGDELIHRILRSLEYRFHPTIGSVPNPAGHAESSGAFRGRLAEEHPLDYPRDDHADPDHD
jgi:hypothetical protein